MTPLCIYHANCLDGFASFMAAVTYFGPNNLSGFPASYGEEPPIGLCRDRDVYIVDFSYSRHELLQISATCNKLVVLDHHASAQRELSGHFPANVYVKFDMNRSGAGIAWNYFHKEPMPEVFQHVQDRDLWKFELPNTKEVCAALFSRPMTVTEWLKFVDASVPVTDLFIEGTALRREHEKRCYMLCEMAQTIEVAGVYVPAVNAPSWYASDVGNMLSERAAFALVYGWDGKRYRCSLRSAKVGGADVSRIAEQFGGGGHKNAAGFSVQCLSELGGV